MKTDAWLSIEIVDLRETDEGREIACISFSSSDGSLSIGEIDVTDWEVDDDD